MFTYISLGLLGVTLFFVLINVLKGLIRGIKKTIGTLVAIVISAIVSAIVTAIVCNPSSEVMAIVMQALKDAIGEGEIADIFAIDAIGEAASYYISMIAAPFVFLALYIVLSLIVGIIVRIALIFIPPLQKPRAVIHRLGGVGVGLVCGVLVSLLLLMPIVGVIDVVVSLSNSEALESVDGIDEITVIFDGAENDAIYSLYSTSTGWMYNSLASADYNGERIYLKNDIEVIVAIVGNISSLSSGTEELADAQITALNAVIDNLDRSALLKGSVAGVIAEMASKWSRGESFMGMEKLDAGEMLDPMMTKMYEVMSTSDVTNIIGDMRTLTDILGVLVKHDLFSDMDDSSSLINKLAGEGVITELMSVTNKNERMSVLSDEITTLSVRALASAIGIPASNLERYDYLMSEMAETLNDSRWMSESERLAYVEEKLGDEFDEYGVEVEEYVVSSAAESLIADFGNISGLEGTDVQEFFMVYAAANGNAGSSASRSGFDYLSDTEYKISVNPDGTISIGDYVLKNYNYANYSSSMAYTMGQAHVDLGDAAFLYSAEAMKSSLITFEDILANVKKYGDCTDPEGEAKKISDILVTAMGVFDPDGEGLDKSHILSNMGELLDMMAETEIFGDKVTADLLKAIFQSKDVRGELGLSISEVNTFTDKLNETANGEESSYTSTTQAVSSTVDVIDKLNDSSISKDERTDATKQLLSDMSPSNADLMGSMTTPSMMVQYGAKEENATVVSSSVSTLLSNMANFQPDTDSEEGQAKYDAEANAVNTLLQLAMDSADSDSNALFNTEDGEEGRTGNTAAEFVDLLVNSEVVGQTLVTTVYEEGNTENPYGVIPTEEDKAALGEELLNYYDENKDNGDDQLMLKLNAVAIISGMEPLFDVAQ